MDNNTVDVEGVMPKLYVVSLNKFAVLFMGTAGLYMAYWFYKQWELYKLSTQGKQIPILRALFSIFFVHSLFNKLTALYAIKSGKENKALNTSATLFVVVSAISFVSGYVPEESEFKPFLLVLNLIFTPVLCWFCYQAQWFINYISDDTNGKTNQKLTGANYVWVVVGTFFWIMYIIGVIGHF